MFLIYFIRDDTAKNKYPNAQSIFLITEYAYYYTAAKPVKV